VANVVPGIFEKKEDIKLLSFLSFSKYPADRQQSRAGSRARALARGGEVSRVTAKEETRP